MLETCLKRSLWEPPDIDIGKLISQAKQHGRFVPLYIQNSTLY